jgi:hypothetical protein
MNISNLPRNQLPTEVFLDVAFLHFPALEEPLVNFLTMLVLSILLFTIKTSILVRTDLLVVFRKHYLLLRTNERPGKEGLHIGLLVEGSVLRRRGRRTQLERRQLWDTPVFGRSASETGRPRLLHGRKRAEVDRGPSTTKVPSRAVEFTITVAFGFGLSAGTSKRKRGKQTSASLCTEITSRTTTNDCQNQIELTDTRGPSIFRLTQATSFPCTSTSTKTQILNSHLDHTVVIWDCFSLLGDVLLRLLLI